jgi:hypothetical protein
MALLALFIISETIIHPSSRGFVLGISIFLFPCCLPFGTQDRPEAGYSKTVVELPLGHEWDKKSLPGVDFELVSRNLFSVSIYVSNIHSIWLVVAGKH